MAINQLTQVRLPNGTVAAMEEWSDRPLYSTCDMLSGFTDEELRLFTYGFSGTVTFTANLTAAQRRQATLRDTNLRTTSEMDATEEYLVYDIKVEFLQFNLNGNTQDTNVAAYPIPRGTVIAQAHANLVLELEVSEKEFTQAPIGFYPAGFGPHLAVDGQAAGTLRTFGVNGYPSHEASYGMSIPVHLGGTEDYTVVLNNQGGGTINWPNDAGATDTAAILRARVYLCGLHKRGMG